MTYVMSLGFGRVSNIRASRISSCRKPAEALRWRGFGASQSCLRGLPASVGCEVLYLLYIQGYLDGAARERWCFHVL